VIFRRFASVSSNSPFQEALLMTNPLYRYSFDGDVPLEDIESAMVLAIFGTETLHGAARTRLESAHYLDREKRLLVLDAGTQVGRDLSRLFTGFLLRELGPDAFRVEQVRGTSEAWRSNGN
jgi:hypothetical protein